MHFLYSQTIRDFPEKALTPILLKFLLSFSCLLTSIYSYVLSYFIIIEAEGHVSKEKPPYEPNHTEVEIRQYNIPCNISR